MRLPLFVQAATFPTFVRAPRSKWLSCKLLLNRPPILTWHQLTPLLTRRTVFSKAGLLCLNSYCPVPFSPRSFVLLCCSLSAPASTIFFLDALASLDFKLSVGESLMFLQLAHLQVFQIFSTSSSSSAAAAACLLLLWNYFLLLLLLLHCCFSVSLSAQPLDYFFCD